MNQLIDVKNIALDPDQLVHNDKIATPMYTSSELFEQEQEKIFRNTWVWVAHTSEIPDKGSFKLSKVGREPVIVVRDRVRETDGVRIQSLSQQSATLERLSSGQPYHDDVHVGACPGE